MTRRHSPYHFSIRLYFVAIHLLACVLEFKKSPRNISLKNLETLRPALSKFGNRIHGKNNEAGKQ